MDKQFRKLIAIRETEVLPAATGVLHCVKDNLFTLCVVLHTEILDRQCMLHTEILDRQCMLHTEILDRECMLHHVVHYMQQTPFTSRSALNSGNVCSFM